MASSRGPLRSGVGQQARKIPYLGAGAQRVKWTLRPRHHRDTQHAPYHRPLPDTVPLHHRDTHLLARSWAAFDECIDLTIPQLNHSLRIMTV
jgi:hypothetical protein